MRTSLLIVSLWGAAVACAKQAPPPTKPDIAADERAIRRTLDGWYTAMQAADSAGTVAPLTPQFLLLEDTLPLTATQLVARLKSDNGGAKWTASFSDFRTRVEGDVAWTTLKNHEVINAPANKKCNADFLETIVFVRGSEGWKIDRYHAAAVHRMTCGN